MRNIALLFPSKFSFFIAQLFVMKYTFSLIAFLFTTTSFSQTVTPSKPKLVVGVVVDQMRWDYLYRYSEKYGNEGFKRLLAGGYTCENTHIPYIPTYTAPGHTCVYTGSVPAVHGIVGNDWYDRSTGKVIYCTSDSAYKTVGTEGAVGRQSPNRMLTTTITDELRLGTNFQSKVIGVAIKDRSSIYPAGHAANGAYWFDGKSGKFITSSYFRDTLPKWVTDFNAQKLPEQYLKENWKTIYELTKYTESTEDDKWYEGNYSNEDHPVFPHKISELTKKNVDVLKATPWGNTLTFEMAKAAVKGENLGKSKTPDFLAVSFSSTDYVGHQFGPNAIEMEDCYLRFDKDLAEFLKFLDTQVGTGNYLLYLTADHGASHAEGFNREHKVPAGVQLTDSISQQLNNLLFQKFGKQNLVESFGNMQVYLNWDSIKTYSLNDVAIKNTLTEYLLQSALVTNVVDLKNLSNASLQQNLKSQISNGYNQKASGDLQIVFKPAVLEDFPKGTTHGTGYAYDTHIPLLWYGWNIKTGKDYSPVFMTDIASTVAALLKIQEPSGCVGKPIEGVLKK